MNLSRTGRINSKPLFIPLLGGLLLVVALLTILPANAREVQQEANAVPDGLTAVEWNNIQSQIMTSLPISQQAKLTADDATAGDSFGYSMAIDGNTAVIGAIGDDENGSWSGSAYIFTRSGITWNQQAKLTADDAAAYDNFGSVAIDGDTVIIGAHADDDGASLSGSVYVFTRSGVTWSQQAKLTADNAAERRWFGWSVAIDGETLIIGAPGDNNGGTESGAAYIFTGSGSTWNQQVKLTASDAATADWFGTSVAVGGNTAVIGAYYDDDGGSNSGSVYIFTRSDSTWSQQTKLVASDAAAGDYFGWSVAMDEETVVIGAYRDNGSTYDSGSAYVFTGAGNAWSQQAKLTAADDDTGDYFGWSVAINGNTAVIGATRNDDSSPNSGSAYVFMRFGNIWRQKSKLTAGDDDAGDYFGASVAIDGKTAIIGATGNDDSGSNSGSAYVFMIPHSANNDFYTTPEDNVLTVISATGVIDNDGGIPPLSVTIDIDVSNGTLNLDLDGGFVYTPNLHFNGVDTFTYILSDGTLTDTAMVMIVVDDPPIAANDLYVTPEDTSLTIAPTGVISNDIDANGDTLSVTVGSGVSNGTLALASDGGFTYTPTLNFNGTDSFTYILSDGILTDTAMVTITVLSTHNLTVILSGTGEGAVSSSPAGISCDDDCNETYVEETAVTLTATATTGYFAGWGGACSGTGSCVVTMDSVQEVTATFSLYTVFLPVVVR